MAAVLGFGFEELHPHKVQATRHADNPASGRAMRKNVMRKEGELAPHIKRDGRYYYLWQYCLTRQRYAPLQQPKTALVA